MSEAGAALAAPPPIGVSATLLIDPAVLDLTVETAELAYDKGMVLSAIETADCNGDGQVGIFPFHVTQPPLMTGAGGSDTLSVKP